jgi:hypothetical protein
MDTWLLVLLIIIGIVLLYVLFEKLSGQSRADSIFAEWMKEAEVDSRVRRRAMTLLNNDEPTAQRLLASLRERYPDKTEQWYWEKMLYDLERDRTI